MPSVSHSAWAGHGVNKLQSLKSFPCDIESEEWYIDSDEESSFSTPDSLQLMSVDILAHKVTPRQTSPRDESLFGDARSSQGSGLHPLELLLLFPQMTPTQDSECCPTPPPPHERHSLPGNTVPRRSFDVQVGSYRSASNMLTPQRTSSLITVSSCSPDFFSPQQHSNVPESAVACASASASAATEMRTQGASHTLSSASPSDKCTPSTIPIPISPMNPSPPPPSARPETEIASSIYDPSNTSGMSASSSITSEVFFSPMCFAPCTPDSSDRPMDPSSASACSGHHDVPMLVSTPSLGSLTAGYPTPRAPASPSASGPLLYLDENSRVLLSAPEAVLKEVVQIPLATSDDTFLYSVCPTSSDVLPMHCLGSGAFGEVKLVYVESPAPARELRMCAVKTIRPVPWYGLAEFEKEAELMGECRTCPHVLHLFSAEARDGDYHMMMEVAGHGCLKDLLWAASQYDDQGLPRIGFPEDVARYLMAGLLLALEHIHARNIVHLDVKPENMLLDTNLFTKLADFGVAQRLEGYKLLQDVAGTPGYQPPEMLQGKGYGTPADIWASGIVAYQLVLGDIPEDWRLELLLERGIFRSPDGVSQELEDLLLGLLAVDPSARITARQAMDHAWFHGFNWEAFQSGTPDCPTITLYHTPVQKPST